LWKKEIENALKNSAVAILLISADFLASEFITNNELPPLLTACEEEGVKVLPVILKPCAFIESEELSRFQSVNPPEKSVLAMSPHESERLWYEISKTATMALKEFSKPNTIVDDIERVQIIDDIPVQYSEIFSSQGLMSLGYFIKAELESPEIVREYYVYKYEHLDILDFTPRAEEFLKPLNGSSELIRNIKLKLKSEGWEGDGTLRLLWFPPFVGAGIEDTWGVITWLVKQSNNGTSFICSPIPLPFSRLLEQNRY